MGGWKFWPPQPWSLVPVLVDPLAVKGPGSVEVHVGGVVGSSLGGSPH